MDDLELKRKRLRYLQLKAKAGQTTNDEPIQLPPMPDDRSLLKKGWDALAIPEQKSREGLRMLTDKLTPSREDIEAGKVGIPGIAARALGEAVTEVAPSFISRGSLVTGGLLKGAGLATKIPLVKTGIRALGSELESASGIAPRAAGALEGAFKDSSLIRAPGKEAAGPLYEAAKAEIPKGMNLFAGKYEPKEILETATAYLSKGGKLEPAEALMARKAVDALMKSRGNVKDELIVYRDIFDAMAKASENISKADPMVNRGIKAAALRKILPQNKLGGASPFKVGVGGTLMGAASIPVLSPAVQGLSATGAGILLRNPKLSGSAIGTILDQIFGNNQ